MRQHSSLTALGLALGAAFMSLGAAAAAQTAPPSTPPSAAPSTTQVSPSAYVVSGWRVECASTSAALACQVLDQVTARPSNTVIASVSVTLGQDGKTPFAVLQTPLGVAVDTPIRMTTPSGATQTLAFLTCTANGCFARAALSDAMLAGMRAANQTLTITYYGLSGSGAKQGITTTLALDGFTAAYAKLR